MKLDVKKTAAASGALLLLAGAATPAFATMDNPAPSAPDATSVEQAAQEVASVRVTTPIVNGIFAFAQDTVNSAAELKGKFANAPQYLCGGETSPSEGIANPLDWSIEVKGDVANSFTATLGELSEEGAAQVTMGCSCAGNPADGKADGNAEVLGVTMTSIMDRAEVGADVNTVVFTSSDGYEIALPFYYVAQRFSIIAFDIAGEPVANSMGGTNQLWLGSTAANYFARDVATITFERREVAPPTPGTKEAGDTYANVPNVSISQGAQAA